MRRFLLSFFAIVLGAICSLRADDTVSAVQTRLKTGGFYSGEINGRYDSETAAAITRYQIRNGLKITGKLDEQTSYALGVSATEPKGPMPPKFGEDVWRQLRKTDQAALDKLIAAAEAKKDRKPVKPAAISASPPPPAEAPPAPAPANPRSAEYTSQRLHDYIAAFVLAGVNSQAGDETEFFADRVDYFGEKGVPREKIRRDLEHYNQRWPERGFRLAGELEVKPGQDRLSVSFPLRYELRKGPKRANGKVWKTIVLEKSGADDFQIVAVNERKMN
ncbi:MAG TPA: peptidoglycan-binding domain-containing protein [Chthoniobacterales bacterium]|jgi:peptidoglycan hydrolase-like protein with peptidoglycan-binding domain|nr:peptidoglycan-binding domain-containing protein [Chthoniobacterales bacterium]